MDKYSPSKSGYSQVKLKHTHQIENEEYKDLGGVQKSLELSSTRNLLSLSSVLKQTSEERGEQVGALPSVKSVKNSLVDYRDYFA